MESQDFSAAFPEAGLVLYTEAGMFVRYLIDTYGLDRMKQAYCAVYFTDTSNTILAAFEDIFDVPLTDVQVGSQYVGDPATGLTSGLLLGFLAESVANTLTIPADVPLVGGEPLSSVLPGGSGFCDSSDDRDLGLDGVTMGWWVYFNFEAIEVTYNGP